MLSDAVPTIWRDDAVFLFFAFSVVICLNVVFKELITSVAKAKDDCSAINYLKFCGTCSEGLPRALAALGLMLNLTVTLPEFPI